MTRIVALLSWWSEDPDWLQATVRSLALAGVDGLLACDGSYPHVPGATAMSDPAQAVAIQIAAKATGFEAYVHRRPYLWASECAKRTAMFKMAEERFQADWLLIIDADEVILQAPADLKARLAVAAAVANRDAAEVCSLEQPAKVLGGGIEGADMPQIVASRWVKPRRCLIRAIPGLTCGPCHYDYVTPDGRNLWGDGDTRALQIRDMVLDHRTDRRSAEQKAARRAYYEARDELGVERHRVTAWDVASAERVAETQAMLERAIEAAS